MESIKITTVEMPKCLMCGKQAEVRVAMENGTPPKSVDYFCKKCYVESFYEALQQQKKELDEEEGKDTNVSTIDDKWEKLKEWIKRECGYTSMHLTERFTALEEVLEQMQELEKRRN